MSSKWKRTLSILLSLVLTVGLAGSGPGLSMAAQAAEASYSVMLTGGENAVASGGSTSQKGLTGKMEPVTFTANDGYYFEKFKDITNNGITSAWTDETKVTVSGTPAADATIKVPDAVKKTESVEIAEPAEETVSVEKAESVEETVESAAGGTTEAPAEETEKAKVTEESVAEGTTEAPAEETEKAQVTEESVAEGTTEAPAEETEESATEGTTEAPAETVEPENTDGTATEEKTETEASVAPETVTVKESAMALAYDGNPYASLVNTTTTVTFNGKPWYIIADNSTAVDAGTVTLLAADTSFGLSAFSDSSSNDYSNSNVKASLDALTTSGSFKDVADAIETNTDAGGKLYLLSTSEAQQLSSDVLKMNFSSNMCSWWLRSSGRHGDEAVVVNGEDGYVGSGYSVGSEFGVRPALKLNLSYVIFSSESNKFSLKPSHTHSFTYSASDATITATCTNTDGNCDLPPSTTGGTDHVVKLTLSADDATYTGSAYTGASLSNTTAWTGAGLTAPTIEYEGRGSTSYTKSTTAPTNAGTYTASITVDTDKTATADFTINPMALTITGATATNRTYDKDSTTVTISAVTFKDSSQQAVALALGEDKDYTVTGAMSDANAGDGKTVNVTVTLKNANYSLATNTTTTTVNISKAGAQTIADVTDILLYTATSVSESMAGKMPSDAGTLSYSAGTASKTGNVTVSNFAVNATSGAVTATLSGGAAGDTVTLPVTIGSTNYADSTANVVITLTAKGTQTITAADVTVSYGDTGKSISATTSGDGAISYAVKTGSEDYIDVNATTGALTIKKVPADGKAYVTVTAAGTAAYEQATKDVTVTINKADPTVTAPTAKTLTYTGSAQELVNAGSATGGEMQYAIGTDSSTAPTSGWSTSIPTATDAGTYYVWYKVIGDDSHADTDPLCVNVTINNRQISAKVTFNVVNGSWNDGTTAAKTVTLTGYEGDTLKLASGQIPSVGSNPAANYKAGSWNVTPSTSTAITADTTYTYTYAQKEKISATVTFKVVNGSWNDKTTEKKTVTLTGYEGDTLKLSSDDIPAVGNNPNTNYKAGSWDVTPSTKTAITKNTTYTYTYAKKSTSSSSSSSNKSAKTGDGSMVWLWSAMIAASVAGLAAVAVKRRGKKN